MQIDTLYGFEKDDLEEIRTAVERALGIILAPHTSSYRGEHYVGSPESTTTLILQRNWDPVDGELMEERFPNMLILLYLTAGDGAAELEQLVASLAAAHLLLRQESLE